MMLRYTIYIAVGGIKMPYTCDASGLGIPENSDRPQ